MREQVSGPWGDRLRIVDKPWGREEWIAYDNGRYAGKILVIQAGERLSLQYHRIKHETLMVQSGRVLFTRRNDRGEDEAYELEAGSLVVVPPGTVHRMEALEDTRMLEFSSPELDDVVRLEDDYRTTGGSAR